MIDGARMFNNKFDENLNSFKMELEQNHNLKHSKNIRNFIFSRRNISTSFFNNEKMNKGNKDENSFNAELINNNISQVINLFEKIHQNNNYISLNKNQIGEIKSFISNYLIQIRKELSKENISIIDAKNIFNSNNTKLFCEILLNPINDTCDPFIQLESIWIINNLMFLVAKYKNFISFEVSEITKLLIQYLVNIYKNQKNDGVKNTLEEKILRIFGNILFLDNNILNLLIENEIIPFIIGSLNSPIPSFRTTCLWLLNKIILIFKKTGYNNFVSFFITKIALSNYKFILSRMENQNSFDEISELFWIFNELVKYDSNILIPIFFTDINYNTSNRFLNLNKEYSMNKFIFILDNCFSDKMIQPCIRLISNLLIICYKNIKDEDLLSKMIQTLYTKESFFRFINEFMNSPKNKFDYTLSEDILLLIFNLVSLSPNNSRAYFKNGIINLINNKDYQNDKKMLNLLFYIYYKIMRNNCFYFEANDELVIKSSLFLIDSIKDDYCILCIMIDLFYCYLKASNAAIDENIENELKIMINIKEIIPNDNLIAILIRLSNLIRMKFNFL